MEELDSLSAFELARKIGRILGIKANVKKINEESGSFFEFDDSDMSVYCADWPIWRIAQTEKGCNKTRASYDSVLSLVSDFLGDGGVSEAVKYCIFAILHEFGHFVFFQNASEMERQEKVVERNRLLAAAKGRLKSDAEHGLSEIKGRSRYERSYRAIPFERIADESALENITLVVNSLVHMKEVDES